MTIAESRKRLKGAVKRLNEIQDSLDFKVVEDEWSVGFENCGKLNSGHHFGVYEYMALFDDFKRKADAYSTAVWVAETIIAATSLNDPKSFHYICNH